VTASVERGTWGPWATLRLMTPSLELEVVDAIGARVIGLRDRRRRREWLLQGGIPDAPESSDWAAEEAAFSGRQSFGWDECLPTVAVCADPRDAGAPPLRDHGDQWARGTSVEVDVERGLVEHTWSGARWPYRFARRLSCPDDDSVLADYTLTSLAPEPLPFLWSQHPVFALEPGCRIDLPGVERVRQTWQRGIELPHEPAWPRATTRVGETLDLSSVRRGEGWATKLYATPPGPVSLAAPGGARLDIDWARDAAPVLGVWLSFGGWPVDGPPVEQVALEPTTSAHDHLAAAMAEGRQRTLGPGDTTTWWVRLRLT